MLLEYLELQKPDAPMTDAATMATPINGLNGLNGLNGTSFDRFKADVIHTAYRDMLHALGRRPADKFLEAAEFAFDCLEPLGSKVTRLDSKTLALISLVFGEAMAPEHVHLATETFIDTLQDIASAAAPDRRATTTSCTTASC